MNEVHFHLVVNHLPIIFPIVGVLILITGLIFKSEAVKRTAFMIFIIGALSSIIAMTSGEGAEDLIENIDSASKKYIHEHEEVSELFALLSYLLGGISLLGLWASWKQKSFSTIISIVTLVFAFVVIFFARESGTTGGEIRHTEIRSDNAGSKSNKDVDNKNFQKNQKRNKKDDD